jgi:Cu-processing system permease protein
MSTRVATARALTGWELRLAVRTRWMLATTAVFAVAFLSITFLGLRAQRGLGLAGASAVIDGLITVTVLLPPLLGLLLGAGSLAGDRERGLLALMAAQPIRRSTLVWTTWAGLTGAVWLTVGLAFALCALVISGVAQAGDLVPMGVLLGTTLAATAAAVAVGVAISAASASRSQAASVAVSLWFLLAFGLDLAVAGLAPALQLGPAGLLVAVVANPLEAARVLALLGTGHDGALLGPFGAFLVSRAGMAGGAAILGGALVAWTAAPLLLARSLLRRRDV